MKNKAIQKFSPFALGIVVLSSQMLQGPVAYGASLSMAPEDASLLKPNVASLQPASTAVTGGGCALAPTTGSGSAMPNSASPAVNAKNLKSSGSSDFSSVLASSATGSLVPSSAVTSVSASDPTGSPNVSSNSSNLVAQVPALDDCCEIGGTTTCEIGGLPPVGGGALPGGLSPLAALAGLPLAGLIPLALGGGDGNNTPPPVVPESSSTAAITAGLGLLGLWYGRRYRMSHKASS